MTPHVRALLDVLNDCRVVVMGLYDGNLEHPALDHIEAAMKALEEVELSRRTK